MASSRYFILKENFKIEKWKISLRERNSTSLKEIRLRWCIFNDTRIDDIDILY